MKKERIKEYTILYQYLLLLKEPTYIFLIQVFQHLSPVTWWEDFIEPVLRRESKENFKYLDIADLLNVFKMNWDKIFGYLDKKYKKFKYSAEYKTVDKIHYIRTIVAHANEIDMSPHIFVNCLSHILKYAKLINASDALVYKLETDWHKYQGSLPDEPYKPGRDDTIKENILVLIEDKVLLKAISCDALHPDIKLSVNRTMLRLRSMRTLEEITGFFNGSLQSDRGQAVHDALSKNGLLGFADIKDEVNDVYAGK